MFPFFLPKGAQGAVLIVDSNPDADVPFEDESPDALESAMHPLLRAIKTGDVKAMAQAFHDAFQIADMAPHPEYDHEDTE